MCECSSVGRASRCQRDCRRFDSGHSLQTFNEVWQVSSVGRAGDWKSPCPQFDSGTGHHFFVLMPDGDTPFGFFCACVWGWIARIYLYFGKTENLKSRHSGGLKSVKIPQILRLAIFGDTGICKVASDLFAARFLKNLSFFLVSPMSAKENFVLRTIVLWVFSLTIKELQSNRRFLFSSQMHTKEQILRCHWLLFCVLAAYNPDSVQNGCQPGYLCQNAYKNRKVTPKHLLLCQNTYKTAFF